LSSLLVTHQLAKMHLVLASHLDGIGIVELVLINLVEIPSPRGNNVPWGTPFLGGNNVPWGTPNAGGNNTPGIPPFLGSNNPLVTGNPPLPGSSNAPDNVPLPGNINIPGNDPFLGAPIPQIILNRGCLYANGKSLPGRWLYTYRKSLSRGLFSYL
jgi:hypothetical protein